jgi:hypothetical protein
LIYSRIAAHGPASANSSSPSAIKIPPARLFLKGGNCLAPHRKPSFGKGGFKKQQAERICGKWYKRDSFAKIVSYVILRERSDRRISKSEMLRFAQHDKKFFLPIQ